MKAKYIFLGINLTGGEIGNKLPLIRETLLFMKVLRTVYRTPPN